MTKKAVTSYVNGPLNRMLKSKTYSPHKNELFFLCQNDKIIVILGHYFLKQQIWKKNWRKNPSRVVADSGNCTYVIAILGSFPYLKLIDCTFFPAFKNLSIMAIDSVTDNLLGVSINVEAKKQDEDQSLDDILDEYKHPRFKHILTVLYR